MAQPRSAIRNFVLSSVAWTPVIAPIDCSYYLIVGNVSGKAMLRSSDPANSDAEYTMPAGGWFGMVAPNTLPSSSDYWNPRYRAGDIVTYLKAASAGDTGPAVIEFIL